LLGEAHFEDGMPKITYQKIPPLSKFKTDSAVKNGNRSEDKILLEIDALLKLIEEPAAVIEKEAQLNLTILLGRLYFNTDLWLKEHAKKIGSPQSADAVYGLFFYVCHSLANRTGLTINLLPRWLSESFGRGINNHAVEVDYAKKSAQYLSPPEADKYRIDFRGGVAYQMPLEVGKTEMLVAETSRLKAIGKAMQEGHAGFVLSMGGDFYSAQHSTIGGEGKQQSFFHSSYMAGGTVRCAGTWKIVGGQVLEITDASGHYRPTKQHLLSAIESLKSYGANISNLQVFIYPDQRVGVSAAKFLEDVKRESLADHRAAYIAQEKIVLDELKKIRLQKIKVASDAKAQKKLRIDEIIVHLTSKMHFDKDGKSALMSKCFRCKENEKETNEANTIYLAEKSKPLAKK
jgi:hypothetical protein